ncbi:MAG TPA: DUF6445 family protein [Usitatibacter sp.]|nr:DUF6445 family protein [Usitatibacter sp.]
MASPVSNQTEAACRPCEHRGAVVIIDDFLADPHAARAFALREEYSDAGAFPGMRAAPRKHGARLARAFEAHVGKPILDLVSMFQYQTAAYESRSYVHHDMCDWAAVLYLVEGHDGEPGTSFHRHREAGLTRGSLQAGAPAPHHDDGGDPAKWEVTLTVPVRFNRLVLYDALMFHRNASAWGSDVHDARLVQAFFACTSLADGPYERLMKRVANQESTT